MTLDAIKQIFLGGGGAVVIIMTIIQITPIKFNPWSWIAKKIGSAINSEVLNEVKAVKADLAEHKAQSAERDATQCRSRILRFGDEILHGVAHSKEHYEQILIDIDSYEEYCDEHQDYKNNVAVATIKHIKKMYQKHLERDSFL